MDIPWIFHAYPAILEAHVGIATRNSQLAVMQHHLAPGKQETTAAAAIPLAPLDVR